MEDLLSMPMTAWLILAVVLGIIEILTPGGFFFVLFATAALVTAIAALAAPSATMAQVILFLALSTLLILFARPILRGMLNIGDRPARDSNAAALVNAEVLVTEAVDQYKGRVKVVHNGEMWTAYLFEPGEGEILPAGSAGVIIKVDGAKLAVRPKA